MNITNTVLLREISFKDFDLMCQIELSEHNRQYTTESPDLNSIRDFILGGQDFLLNKQLRLTIDFEGKGIGFIDLTDADFEEMSAWVGIYINEEFRKLGLAESALKKIEFFADKYNLRRLFARVNLYNEGSLALFSKSGYKIMEQSQTECYLSKELHSRK